jgi:hypothetical protein
MVVQRQQALAATTCSITLQQMFTKTPNLKLTNKGRKALMTGD